MGKMARKAAEFDLWLSTIHKPGSTHSKRLVSKAAKLLRDADTRKRSQMRHLREKRA